MFGQEHKKIDAGGDENLTIKFMWPYLLLVMYGWLTSLTLTAILDLSDDKRAHS